MACLIPVTAAQQELIVGLEIVCRPILDARALRRGQSRLERCSRSLRDFALNREDVGEITIERLGP